MMKKVTAILLLAVLLLGSCFTLASAAMPDLSFLTQTYNYTQAKGVLSMTLNRPLAFLSLLDEEAGGDVVSFTQLLEGLFDSSVSFEVQQEMSADQKQMKAAVLTDTSLVAKLNDCLGFDVQLGSNIWMDLDLRDAEQPSLQYIMQTPASSKYMVLDEDELVQELSSVFALLFDSDMIQRLQEETIELLLRHASVTQSRRQTTVVFDEEGVKAYLLEVLRLAGELSGTDEWLSDEDLDAFAYVFEKIHLFGEEALKITYEQDATGRLAKETMVLHIDANLYDIVTAFEGDSDGLTPENGVIDCSMLATTTYTYHGTPVQMPELTEENSFRTSDLYAQEQYDDDYAYEDYVPEKQYYYIPVEGIRPAEDVQSPTFPLRALLNGMFITDEEIVYDNGLVTVTCSDPAWTGFQTLSFYENSNVVTKDGQDIWLDTPVVEQDGSCIVGTEFMASVFGAALSDVHYDFESNETSYMFVRRMEQQAPDIGLIGGTDGPTAILIQ